MLFITKIFQNAVSGEPAMKLFFAYNDETQTQQFCSPYALSSTPLKQTFNYAISNSTGKKVILVAYTDNGAYKHIHVW